MSGKGGKESKGGKEVDVAALYRYLRERDKVAGLGKKPLKFFGSSKFVGLKSPLSSKIPAARCKDTCLLSSLIFLLCQNTSGQHE